MSKAQVDIARLAIRDRKIQSAMQELQTEIAHTAAKDSGEIKSLTILGFFFLPANLIAVITSPIKYSAPPLTARQALFGIDKYQISGQIIGMYFAWTAPFIVFVFGLLYLQRLLRNWINEQRPVSSRPRHARHASDGSEIELEAHRIRYSTPV